VPEVTQFGQERQKKMTGVVNEYTITTVYTLEKKKNYSELKRESHKEEA